MDVLNADLHTMPLRQLRMLIVLGALLASFAGATVTFAATRVGTSPSVTAQLPVTKPPLVVPDVRGQVYVFAKGMLEDAGFGFRVQGAVPGYAANVIAVQDPAPGMKVVDTGAPTVTLTLTHANRATHGVPENTAPYPSTALLLYHPLPAATRAMPKTPATTAVAPKPTAKAAHTLPAEHTRPAAQTHPATKSAARLRPPAFVVPGAPREPVDQISLVQRAQRLDGWVSSHPVSTPANVRYWLYQHSWIVTGATLGWWHGTQALLLLISTDRRVQSEWGVGSLSLQQAQAALAQVKARMRTR